jgi:hypothetical protein
MIVYVLQQYWIMDWLNWIRFCGGKVGVFVVLGVF